MIIGDKDYDSIIITDSDGGVLAVVSDTEIIERDGFEVILEPTKENC